MACYLGVITHDAVVANDTIMSKMAISHNKAIAADNSFFPVNSTTIDSHKLPYRCIVANDDLGILALELQVLGDSGNNGARKNPAILTDSCPFHDRYIRANPCAIAYLNILVNNSKRIDLYIRCQPGIWMNISVGMNHLIKVSPNIAGRGVAKVIVNAKQRIFFKTVILR